MFKISVRTGKQIISRSRFHCDKPLPLLTKPFSNMPDQSGSITNWVKPGDKTGEYKRQQSTFRNWISRKPGAEFSPEKDRYHLYVSYACPWANRVLIVRKLKGLEEFLPFTSVHWSMLEKGWRFAEKGEDVPGENVTPDPLHPEATHVRDLYFMADKNYDARFTVPVLWDKKKKTIVNNESYDIIQMLYTEFDDVLPEKYKSVDLYPKDLQSKIDEIYDWTYNDINNGVYKSGFATTQEAYEKNVYTLFKSLDRAEADLGKSEGPYYLGNRLTQADICLFTTIVRFDPVYHSHFKCNIRDIRHGYPNLNKWMKFLYWNDEAFGGTTQFEHIKKHYTKSHKQINPFSITPVGPVPDIMPADEKPSISSSKVEENLGVHVKVVPVATA